MSSNIQISGPFIKRLYQARVESNGPGSFLRLTRTEVHPLAGTDVTDGVPSPWRRMMLIIQNKSDATIKIELDPDNARLGTGWGLELASGQTVTLDNYNGFAAVFSDSTNVAVFEAFI